MLNNEQLNEILEQVKQKIFTANCTGELEDLLIRIGISLQKNIENVVVTDNYVSNPNGKIVIIGGAKMKRNNFEGLVKEKYGFSNAEIQKRFELVLEYEGLNHYNFQKLSKYDYAVIIMGPVPHSVTGRGDHTSLTTMLEDNEDNFFPPVYRLDQGRAITKDQVEMALDDLIKKEVINF